MEIDPPYRLDPFQNIVNVHWKAKPFIGQLMVTFLWTGPVTWTDFPYSTGCSITGPEIIYHRFPDGANICPPEMEVSGAPTFNPATSWEEGLVSFGASTPYDPFGPFTTISAPLLDTPKGSMDVIPVGDWTLDPTGVTCTYTPSTDGDSYLMDLLSWTAGFDIGSAGAAAAVSYLFSVAITSTATA